MIAFDMEQVTVIDADGMRLIDDYEELREWWKS